MSIPQEPSPKRQKLDEHELTESERAVPDPSSSLKQNPSHNPTITTSPDERSLEPEDKEDVDNPSRDGLPPLEEFTVSRVLFNNAKTKQMCVTGKFPGHSEDCAVIFVERQPLTEADIGRIFSSKTTPTRSFQNNIYAQYTACSPDVGGVKLLTVYPATDAHIRKYSNQPLHLLYESPRDYESITKPFIEKAVLGLQWVYNILDGKAEADRVIFNDLDPTVGFLLLPDLKWDQKDMDNVYMLAIVHRRGLACMRDLNGEHLPLLKHILDKGKQAINAKYGLPLDQIRVYLHYPPSYYHLHVHFTHVSYEAPKTAIGRAHLLEDVIDNIENIDSYYYQKRTVSFVVKEDSPLWQHFALAREQLSIEQH